uniref:Uncharacterized protein n=1 Tax=Anopheles farauti TaxID=69004 RepID=A0A182QFN7_9DIPT
MCQITSRMPRLITRFGTTSITLLPGCRSITGRTGRVIMFTVDMVSWSREDTSGRFITRSTETVGSERLSKRRLQEAHNSTTYTPVENEHLLRSRFGTLSRSLSCKAFINCSQALEWNETKRTRSSVSQSHHEPRKLHKGGVPTSMFDDPIYLRDISQC